MFRPNTHAKSGGISSNHLLNLHGHSQCWMSDATLTLDMCNPSPAGHRRRGINLICSHYKMNLALERRDPSTRQPAREMMKWRHRGTAGWPVDHRAGRTPCTSAAPSAWHVFRCARDACVRHITFLGRPVLGSNTITQQSRVLLHLCTNSIKYN